MLTRQRKGLRKSIGVEWRDRRVGGTSQNWLQRMKRGSSYLRSQCSCGPNSNALTACGCLLIRQYQTIQLRIKTSLSYLTLPRRIQLYRTFHNPATLLFLLSLAQTIFQRMSSNPIASRNYTTTHSRISSTYGCWMPQMVAINATITVSLRLFIQCLLQRKPWYRPSATARSVLRAFMSCDYNWFLTQRESISCARSKMVQLNLTANEYLDPLYFKTAHFQGDCSSRPATKLPSPSQKSTSLTTVDSLSLESMNLCSFWISRPSQQCCLGQWQWLIGVTYCSESQNRRTKLSPATITRNRWPRPCPFNSTRSGQQSQRNRPVRLKVLLQIRSSLVAKISSLSRMQFIAWIRFSRESRALKEYSLASLRDWSASMHLTSPDYKAASNSFYVKARQVILLSYIQKDLSRAPPRARHSYSLTVFQKEEANTFSSLMARCNTLLKSPSLKISQRPMQKAMVAPRLDPIKQNASLLLRSRWMLRAVSLPICFLLHSYWQTAWHQDTSQRNGSGSSISGKEAIVNGYFQANRFNRVSCQLFSSGCGCSCFFFSGRGSQRQALGIYFSGVFKSTSLMQRGQSSGMAGSSCCTDLGRALRDLDG